MVGEAAAAAAEIKVAYADLSEMRRVAVEADARSEVGPARFACHVIQRMRTLVS
jgi:hypothetical protein